MNPKPRKWIPTPEFILQVFQQIGKIPECNDIVDAKCRNFMGLFGIIDKITYGWPGNHNPSILDCAAIIIHDLTLYHFFTDGNKRIGFMMMVIFLNKNGYVLDATDDEKVEFTLSVAQDLPSFDEIINWIVFHSIKHGS